MRRWWLEMAGLVLPADCAGCGRARTVLCGACRARLYGHAPCRVLPEPVPAGLPWVYAAAPYGGCVRSALLAHKERGALGLAEPLGAALAGAAGRAGAGGAGYASRGARGPFLLVPVPSARRAVAGRGHDPVLRIARAATRALRGGGVPARVAPVLRLRRAVADQSGLDARGRLANVAGAMGVVRGGERLWRDGGVVVLVDDLMTTGASLAEAARAVGAVGGRVAGAAVVAAASRAFEKEPELTGKARRSSEKGPDAT
ncbi:ComF family protein [Streptomyces mashuensis]|uniref:ComF family protein n=1 Tax=Streptomyces mashuensis TaxID=33904 RepID=UPI001E3BF84B|nr:phosphoribosyltransferase family protein [Streptomyces mashuensis]